MRRLLLIFLTLVFSNHLLDAQQKTAATPTRGIIVQGSFNYFSPALDGVNDFFTAATARTLMARPYSFDAVTAGQLRLLFPIGGPNYVGASFLMTGMRRYNRDIEQTGSFLVMLAGPEFRMLLYEPSPESPGAYVMGGAGYALGNFTNQIKDVGAVTVLQDNFYVTAGGGILFALKGGIGVHVEAGFIFTPSRDLGDSGKSLSLTSLNGSVGFSYTIK